MTMTEPVTALEIIDSKLTQLVLLKPADPIASEKRALELDAMLDRRIDEVKFQAKNAERALAEAKA